MRVEFRDIPGITKLFSNFVYDPGSLSKWLGGDFRELSSYERTSGLLARSEYQRDKLADMLLRQNRLFGDSHEAADAIEKIRRGALCVVTGHQICFLGGPLLVLYKAFTVSKLAAKLSSKLDMSVVPVFWMATDDHDFEEINHVYLPDQNGKLSKIEYAPSGLIPGQPVSELVLEEEIDGFREAALGAMPAESNGRPLVSSLVDLYRKGERASTAFAKTLRLLCPDKSLILFDPSDSQAKELSAPIFRQEILSGEDTRRAIVSASESLVQTGYHQQVVRDHDSLNLFYVAGARRKIKIADGRLEIADFGDRRTREELAAEVDSDPSRFSPNVLLRLIVQSRLFPAVGYVGGPAEVAYFAQAKGLFDLFGVTPPVVHMRLSATLVEQWCRRLIEKHSIELGRLARFTDREEYLTEILRTQFPDEHGKSLSETRSRIMKEMESIGLRISADKDLIRTLEQTRKKIDFELKSFEEKAFKSHRKANDDFTRKYRLMADALFPEQSLQERHYNLLHFLNKYGQSVLEKIRDNLDIDVTEHQVIAL